jgi:kinetochore protein Mis12/MTW1
VTRERKVYVESQSKRILERRGVDTRDGVEGVWEGRRVGAEEVKGLEGLVKGLGRGKTEEKERKEDVDVGMDEVETDTDAGAGEVEEMDTT